MTDCGGLAARRQDFKRAAAALARRPAFEPRFLRDTARSSTASRSACDLNQCGLLPDADWLLDEGQVPTETV